jgi:HK97 gp10 family phage protein
MGFGSNPFPTSGYRRIATGGSSQHQEQFEIFIRGDLDIEARLAVLEKGQARKIVRRGSRAGAKRILPTARSLAPHRTGQLRGAIRVRAGKRSRKYIAVRCTCGKDWFKGDTFYGGFQEWGWQTGKRGSAARRQVKGKHFMERAYNRKKGAAMNEARRVILAEIEQAVRM